MQFVSVNKKDSANLFSCIVYRALSDAGPTDSATVSFTVTITDINDNTPTFGTAVFCRAIPSNSPAGE